MREFKFDLSKHEGITGELVLGIPTYRQRLVMLKDCQFKTNSDGEIASGVDSVDSLIKMIDVAKPFFNKIQLQCGDAIATNFDELESYQEFDAIIIESATAIMSAGKMGKTNELN